MKKRGKKMQPNDYPRFTVRVDKKLLARVRAVRSNRKMSFGSIVNQALRRFLPEFEK